MALQTKILRALQEHTVVKVGDSRPETVDLRVIAATHRVLEDEVKAGRFREDLYYRLNVVQLTVPPLRDRGDDVLMLARYFLKHFGEELKSPGRALSKGAVEAVRRYRWPGNVRELENRIKKALVLSDRSLLTADDLELGGLSDDSVLSLAEAKTKFQRDYINEVLERNSGNRTKTARDLGVDARTIFRHLERLEAERTGQALPPSELDLELDTRGLQAEGLANSDRAALAGGWLLPRANPVSPPSRQRRPCGPSSRGPSPTITRCWSTRASISPFARPRSPCNRSSRRAPWPSPPAST